MAIELNNDRVEIANAIYEAEITTDLRGGSAGTVLQGYADAIRKLDPKKLSFSKKLMRIASRIINGEKSSRVYANYLDRDILYILEEASNEGMRTGQVIKEYLPIKKLSTAVKKKIRAKLKVPIIVSFLAVMIMGYVTESFLEIINGGDVEGDLSAAKWVAENFYYISLTIFVLITVPLLLFPQKMPKIKEIFRKTDALMAILLIKILNAIGQSPVKIIPFLKRTFNLKTPTKKNNLEGLSTLLYKSKYVNIYQASKLMKVSSVKKDFPVVLQEVLDNIRLDVELSSEIIQEAIGNIAILLIIIPIVPALYVILSVVKAILVTAGM